MNSGPDDQVIDTATPPSLDMVVKWLIEIADVPAIDPDLNLNDQDVDSLDLIELAASIEDQYGVAFDESLLDEALTDDTLRQVYERVILAGKFGT